MPIATKATVSPSEYTASRITPRTIVRESAASTRIALNTTPTQGAAQTAKAAPSSAREPDARARLSAPGATSRSGHGKRPMKASPSTTSTKPASFVLVERSTQWPSAAAPAPSATKTTVNPSANAALILGAERPRGQRPLRCGLALARPAPGERADHRRAAEDADDRQQPREQVEPVPRRRGEDPRPPLRHQPALDLAARVPGRDPLLDLGLDPLRGRRVRLREGLALAARAHQLPLELGEARMLLA